VDAGLPTTAVFEWRAFQKKLPQGDAQGKRAGQRAKRRCKKRRTERKARREVPIEKGGAGIVGAFRTGARGQTGCYRAPASMAVLSELTKLARVDGKRAGRREEGGLAQGGDQSRGFFEGTQLFVGGP